MNDTKDTPATVIAYGSCVCTCSTWLHCAPADAMIVVSEIGEQWSPQTAPARQADIPITPIVVPAGNTARTIGIRIPNVPQDVPVENAITQATIKMIAGKNTARLDAPERRLSTNTSEPSPLVIFLSAVAKVRIRIAGTIATNPLGIEAIDSLNVIALRHIR